MGPLQQHLNGPLQQHLNGPQFKRACNNNIDPGNPDPLNFIFVNHFKWALYNNSDQGGPDHLIYFLPTNLNGIPTIIFKWPRFQKGLHQYYWSREPGPPQFKFITNLKMPPAIMFKCPQFKWAL